MRDELFAGPAKLRDGGKMSRKAILIVLGLTLLSAAAIWFAVYSNARAEAARLQAMHDSVVVSWQLENITREMQGLSPKAAPPPTYFVGDAMPVYIGCGLLTVIGSISLLLGIAIPGRPETPIA